MIVNSEFENESLVVATGKTTTMGISNNAVFLHNLSDTLYQHKMLAAIREPICNAWDAHTDAGIPKRPVLVTITDSAVHIKDYGKGIAKDCFAEIYGTFGNSTKQNDDNQIGGFGLGCKAPYAYVDTFTVISCHEGIKTIYSLNKVSHIDGKPAITEIASMPTTDTGLEVIIPFKTESLTSDGSVSRERQFEINKIKQVVRSTALFATQTILLKTKENRKALKLPSMDPIEINKGHIVVSGKDNNLPSIGDGMEMGVINVLYNNVLYPVNLSNIEDKIRRRAENAVNMFCGDDRWRSRNYNNAMIIRANPGDIFVTPSRETLSYTETTKNTLNNLIKETCDYISSKQETTEKYGKAIVESLNNMDSLKRRIISVTSDIESVTESLVLSESFNIAKSEGILADPLKHTNHVSSIYYNIKPFTVLNSDNKLKVYLDMCNMEDSSFVRDIPTSKLAGSKYSFLHKLYHKLYGYSSISKKSALTYRHELKDLKNDLIGIFFKLGLQDKVHLWNDNISSHTGIPGTKKLLTVLREFKRDKYFQRYSTREEWVKTFCIERTAKIVYLYHTKSYLTDNCKSYRFSDIIHNNFVDGSLMDNLRNIHTNTFALQLKRSEIDTLGDLVRSLENDGFIVIDHFSEEIAYRKQLEIEKESNQVVEDAVITKRTNTPSNVRVSFSDVLDNENNFESLGLFPSIKDEDSSFVIHIPNSNIKNDHLLGQAKCDVINMSSWKSFMQEFLARNKINGTAVSTELRYQKAIEDGLIPFEEFMYKFAYDYVNDPKNLDTIKSSIYVYDYSIHRLLMDIAKCHYIDNARQISLLHQAVEHGVDFSTFAPFFSKYSSEMSSSKRTEEEIICYEFLQLYSYIAQYEKWSKNIDNYNDTTKDYRDDFLRKLRYIFEDMGTELVNVAALCQLMHQFSITTYNHESRFSYVEHPISKKPESVVDLQSNIIKTLMEGIIKYA